MGERVRVSVSGPLEVTALVTKTYNQNGVNTAFVFREDGWFNMTKAAKVFGKDLSNYLRSPECVEYVAALKSVKSTEYVEASRGRNGGTWAHPKLAVFFARWLGGTKGKCRTDQHFQAPDVDTINI